MGQTQTADIPTWNETIELIKEGKVKLINVDLEQIEEHCTNMNKWNQKKFPNYDCFNSPIAQESGYGGIKDGVSTVNESYAIIYNDDNTPVAIIRENELGEAFKFGDIVSCQGHDSTTLYNVVTGEHKVQYTR
jgi:hypothetical protein